MIHIASTRLAPARDRWRRSWQLHVVVILFREIEGIFGMQMLAVELRVMDKGDCRTGGRGRITCAPITMVSTGSSIENENRERGKRNQHRPEAASMYVQYSLPG